MLPDPGERRGPQVPPPGDNAFLNSLIRSATAPEAQIFTEATYPFKICHANNAWSLLCGFSVPEALGKTCKILQGPETDPERLRELHAGIAANRKTTVQLINYTKSRDRFLNELTIEPLLNPEGGVTHFIGTLVPLTRPASMASSPKADTPMALPQGKPPSTVSGKAAAKPKGEQGRASAGGAGSSAGAAAGSSGLGGAQGPRLSGGEGSMSGEYTDLLSRGSFPLHTLNHHPNAPVLLRMLQLNNCSMGRSSFGSRSSFSDEFGSRSFSDEQRSAAQLGLTNSGLPSLTQATSPTASAEAHGCLSALLAKAWGGNNGRGGAAATLGQEGAPLPHAMGGGGAAASSAAAAQQAAALGAMPGLGQPAPERGRCNTESFLAAVAGQGVLPMCSWPKPPGTSPRDSAAGGGGAGGGGASAGCPSSPHGPGGGGADFGGPAGGLGGGLGGGGTSGEHSGGQSPSGHGGYGKRTCGDPTGPPEMRQRLQPIPGGPLLPPSLLSGGADPLGGDGVPRRASMGGPGPDGQWAPPQQDPNSSSPTPLVGEDIIELDDIFDVLDNWDEFEKQPELRDRVQQESRGSAADEGGAVGGMLQPGALDLGGHPTDRPDGG